MKGKAPVWWWRLRERAPGAGADEKQDIYAGTGVAEYWRFDPTGRWLTTAMVGERLMDSECQTDTQVRTYAVGLRRYKGGARYSRRSERMMSALDWHQLTTVLRWRASSRKKAWRAMQM